MAKDDWCPRQTYYRIRDVRAGLPYQEPGTFSFQLQNIFGEGNQIHTKWQTWFQEMGRLWGTWECAHCNLRQVGEDPGWCDSCQSQGFLYKEVTLFDDETLIHGHEDGADLHTDALIEIKSVGIGTIRFDAPSLLREHTHETVDGKSLVDLDGLWKAIRRPLPAHIRQTSIYGYLAAKMGLPFDRIIFIYEFKPTQATKEFVIKYNPEIAAPLIEKADDIVYALKKGVPPARGDKTATDARVCKDCLFNKECYGQDSKSKDEDVDLGPSGGGVRARRKPSGPGGPSPARATRRRRSEDPGRTDGDPRRLVNVADGPDDGVAGLHGGDPGRSGGRRVVRRRRG